MFKVESLTLRPILAHTGILVSFAFFFFDFREIQNLGSTGANIPPASPTPFVCVFVLSCVSLPLYGLWPTRLLCPWNFLSKNTGMSCYFLLQGIFLIQGSNLGLLHCRQILCHLSHPLDVSFIEQSIKLIRESHGEENKT